MNKSVYLALIGATAAQKTPFAKQREAHLHKRKLQELDWETFDMEAMESGEWDEAAWEMGEPMEWETTAMEWDEPMEWEEEKWDEPIMEPMYLDFYLAKDDEGISQYFETYPQYNVFFDLSDMEEAADGTQTISGWFNVVHDQYYKKTESCKTSAVIDMTTGGPADGVNVLAHEWNYECSFEGQNLAWISNGDGPDDNGILIINGDEYQMYEYEAIYGDNSSYEYQEFYLSPQGADLADYFDTYPQYSVFSTEIDTKSDPITAAYMLYIYHDMMGDKMEICYLTATLDSYMAPSSGLTVVENDMYSYDCSLKDGEMIKYDAPAEGLPTAGAVYINDTMFDLYEWEALEDVYQAYSEKYYDEEWEDEYWEDDMDYWEDEWAYDYDDWEYDYDYDYGMEDWDYYGYGETYYYMDGPERGPDGIMEQITGWFSGDASNKLFTAIASIATVAAMQL